MLAQVILAPDVGSSARVALLMPQSSSDEAIGGPAPQGEATDDESDGIVLGPLAADRGAGRGRGRAVGRPRPAPTRGRFSALLTVDERLSALVDLPDWMGSGVEVYCAGVCECEWVYRMADPDTKELHELAPFKGSAKKGTEPYGFVQYEVHRAWRLQRFVSVDHIIDRVWDEEAIGFMTALVEMPLRSGGFMRDALQT